MVSSAPRPADARRERVHVPARAAAATRDWLVGHRERDIPGPALTPRTAGLFVVDELSHQTEFIRSWLRPPAPVLRRRMRTELDDAVALAERRGWLADPRTYHRTPPPLETTSRRLLVPGPLHIDEVEFASGFEPWPDEPGRDRWLSYARNRTAHVWVVRHPGPPRPWVVCINGYRTGNPVVDLATFRARHLHRQLGLNLAFLVLPLQGPRQVGRVSGDRVFTSGVANTLHAVSQAVWDARRLLGWIRTEAAGRPVGVAGVSLGGLVAALLAGFEPELANVVAIVPETDVVRSIRRHVEPLLLPFYEQWGLSWTPVERLFGLVSPLAMPAVTPRDRRFIVGGLVDRWVRPSNIKALWEHWDRPELLWYQGSHLSFAVDPAVRGFVDDVLVRTLAEPG